MGLCSSFRAWHSPVDFSLQINFGIHHSKWFSADFLLFWRVSSDWRITVVVSSPLQSHLFLFNALLYYPQIFKVLNKSVKMISFMGVTHILPLDTMLLLLLSPTLCDPIDGSPPGSPIPGILQARTLELAAISFSNAWKWKVKVKSLSGVRLCATPWTAAYQTLPPMGFSKQEYWSRVPLPSQECYIENFFCQGRILINTEQMQTISFFYSKCLLRFTCIISSVYYTLKTF